MDLEKLMKTRMAKKLFKEAGFSDEEMQENVEMISEVINIDTGEEGPAQQKRVEVAEDNIMLAEEILLGMSEALRTDPPINQVEFDARFEYDLLELKYIIAERMGDTTLERRIIADIDTVINALTTGVYQVEVRKHQTLHLLELWERLIKWQKRIQERRDQIEK
jgi:hypothetical protein